MSNDPLYKWLLCWENNVTDDHALTPLGVFDTPEAAMMAVGDDRQWVIFRTSHLDEYTLYLDGESEYNVRPIPYNPKEAKYR